MIALPLATTKCPATFCPLFARDGSPWTGTQGGDCIKAECGWWASAAGKCIATSYAVESLAGSPREHVPKPAPPCPHESMCQWQRQTKELCPPRLAVTLGIDPHNCAW